jgi:hypothetical protein
LNQHIFIKLGIEVMLVEVFSKEYFFTFISSKTNKENYCLLCTDNGEQLCSPGRAGSIPDPKGSYPDSSFPKVSRVSSVPPENGTTALQNRPRPIPLHNSKSSYIST